MVWYTVSVTISVYGVVYLICNYICMYMVWYTLFVTISVYGVVWFVGFSLEAAGWRTSPSIYWTFGYFCKNIILSRV